MRSFHNTIGFDNTANRGLRVIYHRFETMGGYQLKRDKLRIIVKQNGFSVKGLAVHVGMDVRTLERHFSVQFHTTPKAWLMRERMSFAPASLRYTCESNFCRDFKRYFGCAPQEFAHIHEGGSGYVAF